MTSSAAATELRILPPVREERDGQIRIAFPVEGMEPGRLWFDVDADHGDLVDPESCDPALAALLPAALARGGTLRVEGPVSPRLLWHLRNTVIPVVRRQLPFLPGAELRAADARPSPGPPGEAVLTGLSCGVDSLSAIRDHLLSDRFHPDQRVTHFLFSHVGHHGYGPEVDQRAEDRWNRAREAAVELGRPIVRMASNTPDFYPSRYNHRLNWAATITLRNAAVPLLLQAGVRRFLLASSHEWSDIRVRPTGDMTEADPVLLPSLGTETLELCQVGTERTRVEKTRHIMDWPLAQERLDVCIMEGGVNCSRCEKCLRTLLTLELLGAVDDFAGRFDLETYRRHRGAYISQVLAATSDAFHLEIRRFIGESGTPVGPAPRLRAVALRAWRTLPDGVRKTLRGG